MGHWLRLNLLQDLGTQDQDFFQAVKALAQHGNDVRDVHDRSRACFAVRSGDIVAGHICFPVEMSCQS
jgi:hypothetical protein